MRNFLLPLLCCFSSLPALAQWQPAGTPGNLGGELLNCQLDAVDGQTAWVINSFYFVPPYTVRLWRTTDGGQSWQSVAPAAPTAGRFTLGTLDALDAQRAWVLLQRQDGAGAALPSELHHTADGGQTWALRTLPAGGSGVARLWFGSATEGVLLDQLQNTVHRSTDGGLSWQPVAGLPGLTSGQRLNDLQEANGVLWTNVHNQWAQTVGFWASTDQGRTWRSQTLPTGPGNGAGITFRDATHALLPTAQGGLLTSADGGRTWAPAATLPFPLGPLVAVKGSRTYVAGAFANTGATTAKGSAISHDDGQTWTPLESTNSYLSLHFPAPNAGWNIRADFFWPTVQYVYQGIDRYTGPALAPLAATVPRPVVAADVYPNPSADGRFTLALPAAARVRLVRVLDALGREVYRTTALPADQRLDLHQQPRGTYFLEVHTDAGVLRHRLLRE